LFTFVTLELCKCRALYKAEPLSGASLADGDDGGNLIATSDADVYAAAPSLNLTPEEKRVFGQLFRQADTESIGVVTGEVAVKFFEKTRLEPRILGEVCNIRATGAYGYCEITEGKR
jgi:hypothetical protein